jgi:hypothetical protein
MPLPTLLPLQSCCSTSWFTAVYNKLTGDGHSCCVSPRGPNPPDPSFLHVCLSSLLNLLPIRLLGQAHEGREKCVGFLLPSMNLFLGIWIFWCYCEWYWFPDFFQDLLFRTMHCFCTMSVVRNVRNFCILILYSANQLNVFIRSKCF